jgi:hypothetical protein
METAWKSKRRVNMEKLYVLTIADKCSQPRYRNKIVNNREGAQSISSYEQ